MFPSRLLGMLQYSCSSLAQGEQLAGLAKEEVEEWNNWKGHIASKSTLSLVASVYDELENMLDAAAPHQILAHGQGWSSIVSRDTSKGSHTIGESRGSIVSLW